MFALFCMLFLFSSVSMPAKAYTQDGQKHWVKDTIYLRPYSGFTDLTLQHMKSSVSQWDQAAGQLVIGISNLSHSDNNASFGSGSWDGVNRIMKKKSDELYTGRTHVNADFFTGYVKEADINLNANKKFANSGQKGCYDTYSVFLHEAGHVIGLGHATSTVPVMYANLGTGVEKRTLQTDDKNGAHYIYQVWDKQ